MFRSPYATRLTVFGVMNMDNNKPYRTRAQKAVSTKEKPSMTTLHKETAFKPDKQQRKHAYRYFMACGDEARAYAALHADS